MNADSVQDDRLAQEGAMPVAAWRQHILEWYGAKALENYDAGCRCWMFRPDPMCPVHFPLEWGQETDDATL